MKIFLDVNIILDELLIRNNFYKDSHSVIEICKTKNSALAPHTIPTTFYFVRKEMDNVKAKSVLLELLKFIDIVPIGKYQIVQALKNNKITDFEDALQLECAKEFNADYFVSRDKRLYQNNKIKVISPREFVKSFS